MIIYNNKESYMVYDESMIPMGSLVFDPANNKLSMLIDERGLVELAALGDELITEYTVSNLPEGAQVTYLDDEIRVMCAADTEWKLQNVGPTGNQNRFYIAFKAYAPNDDVMSFKESENGTVTDEMFFFEDNAFAGIETDGRKYSLVWLPVASYDAEADSWTYFGAKSTKEKYIGWNYVVEWYDANGNMISTDSVRINLSNENCHE